MGFEELKTRLQWFVEEKENLHDAEIAVRGVHANVNAIQFNVAANTTYAGAIAILIATSGL